MVTVTPMPRRSGASSSLAPSVMEKKRQEPVMVREAALPPRMCVMLVPATCQLTVTHGFRGDLMPRLHIL